MKEREYPRNLPQILSPQPLWAKDLAGPGKSWGTGGKTHMEFLCPSY